MSETEFQVGDEVTFNAYHEPIRAKVREIVPGEKVTNNPDGRVFYRLEGISKPLVSVTTGRSIEESRYFTHTDPMEALK